MMAENESPFIKLKGIRSENFDLSALKVPRDNEESAREFCKRHDFNYMGLDGRYAFAPDIGTYIRKAEYIVYVDGAPAFLANEDELIF